MNTIDLVQSLEEVGFTRKQAERQVVTIQDIKQGLATQKDLLALESKVDTKFDAMLVRFDAQDTRFDAQDKRIDAVPFKTAMYICTIAGVIIALIKSGFIFIK